MTEPLFMLAVVVGLVWLYSFKASMWFIDFLNRRVEHEDPEDRDQ